MDCELELKDACGLYGCVLTDQTKPTNFDLPQNMVDGLSAIQHRGTESSGMVGSNGDFEKHFTIYKGKGLVREVYGKPDKMTRFNDNVLCVGHNRYSTAGLKDAINCIQPFVVHTVAGLVAVAHNGELVDAGRKRNEILKLGVGLSTDTDSELIAQILSQTIARREESNIEEYYKKNGIGKEILQMMNQLTLAYSLLIMTYDRLYAVRDPWGNRPLCIGKYLLNGTEDCTVAWIVASETCALHLGAKLVREVEPGEIIEITRNGFHSCARKVLEPERPLAMCIFEFVYFARPTSVMDGVQIQTVRSRCGRQLAVESPIDADIVSNVPDSANPAALGYAQKSGIEYVPVLSKNPYVGRTFIQPNTKLRQSGVMRKFGPLHENFNGKRVVLVDDSIVRGNTMVPIVKLLREYGAKEVHIRVASPPVRHPCYMGINIPRADELLAHKFQVSQIAQHMGADSVKYLSVEGLVRAVQGENNTKRHCTACLTGEYPIDIDKRLDW